MEQMSVPKLKGSGKALGIVELRAACLQCSLKRCVVGGGLRFERF